MPIKKKLLITAATITGIVIITVIVLLTVLNFFKISYNSNERDEIESPITITRDSKGIPYIEAESENDFYFALGYLHATDRLNVIEYLRSIASGETEKFAGSDSSLLNNLSKTIGFTKNAEEITLKLKENETAALKNYVKGINHVRRKNRVRNLISREWRIEDVIAILSMKEWANSYLNNKELIFNLQDTKISTSKNIFSDNRYLYFYNEEDLRYLYTLRRIKEIIEKYICTFSRGNSIYVSPEYSSSGTDSFLTLNHEDSSNIYPGWYPVQILLKGKKISALTYNGLPFILSFKNEKVSITQVNVNADTQNFYLFDTEYRNSIPHYNSAGTWKEYKSVRIPSFNDNEMTSEIKWVSDKGPVFSELISSAKIDTKILVIDSIQPGIEYISFMLRIPFETEVEKVRQAVTLNDSTLKCFIISDNKKAYKVYSGFVNQSENNNRIFIEGSKSFKPSAAKISVSRQISGLDYSGSDLVQVNEISSLHKYVITNEFRIERFNSLLVKKKIYDNNRIKDFITDNQSVAAQKFVPVFLTFLGANPLTSSKLSKIYFTDWDYTAKPGLQAPSIFYSILWFYISESYRDDFGPDSDFNFNSTYLLFPEFYEQVQKRITTIFDKPETPNIESREMIFDIAFLNAMRFLNRNEGPLMEHWKWGLFNKSSYKIPSDSLNFLSRFYKIEALPLFGGSDTIENVIQNSKFKTISSTSFQSFMTNDAVSFKMNSGYSTSMLSDFYYGNGTISDFENMSNPAQIYKTTINNR
jgi:penicillin amidase